MEYLDLDDAEFRWPRADAGYAWDEAAPPHNGMVPPFLMAPETSEIVSYRPLDDSRLFLRFSDTVPDPANVIAFANTYGTLTRADSRGRAEDFTTWKREIANMAEAVSLWESVKNDDVRTLEAIITWSKDLKSVRYRLKGQRGILASARETPRRFGHIQPGDVLLPAKLLLLDRVNHHLASASPAPGGVTVALRLDASNSFVSRVVPKDLRSAMWFQLCRAVTGERRYKRCTVCGRWEDVSDKTARWSKHVECANRERVARYRGKSNEGDRG